MDAINRAQNFSNEKIELLRRELGSIAPDPYVVVACGSYARREASQASDLDYFVVKPDGTRDPTWGDNLKAKIKEIVPIDPAMEGAFSQFQDKGAMLKNIGGEEDHNTKLTRRILFLLEGEWLTNAAGLRLLRKEIIERYILDKITDHQLALFLLNDIIRYYRTVAVDYEFKTVEDDKPWGIRNIKLVFSRKLLYSSGLFAVAMTADRTFERKREILEELFNLPVIDRMIRICGVNTTERAFECYDNFLEQMGERQS